MEASRPAPSVEEALDADHRIQLEESRRRLRVVQVDPAGSDRGRDRLRDGRRVHFQADGERSSRPATILFEAGPHDLTFHGDTGALCDYLDA